MHLNITEAAASRVPVYGRRDLAFPFANCVSVFTSLLLSFLVHSYEDY